MANASYLDMVLGTAPATPGAGEVCVYVDSNGNLATKGSSGNVKTATEPTVTNTGDAGPTAGADFYLAASAIPVAELVAGASIKWCISATKTAACTGTPTWSIRLGTAQSTADTQIASAVGVAQTAAVDTGWWEINAILRAATATGTLSWAMKWSHKNATTGFQNQAQDQVFNGTTGSQNFTTAGLYLGLSVNPTATGANGVWTFQTIQTEVRNPS